MRIRRFKIAKREMIFNNKEIFAKTPEIASLASNVGHLVFYSRIATYNKYWA